MEFMEIRFMQNKRTNKRLAQESFVSTHKRKKRTKSKTKEKMTHLQLHLTLSARDQIGPGTNKAQLEHVKARERAYIEYKALKNTIVKVGAQ